MQPVQVSKLIVSCWSPSLVDRPTFDAVVSAVEASISNRDRPLPHETAGRAAEPAAAPAVNLQTLASPTKLKVNLGASEPNSAGSSGRESWETVAPDDVLPLGRDLPLTAGMPVGMQLFSFGGPMGNDDLLRKPTAYGAARPAGAAEAFGTDPSSPKSERKRVVIDADGSLSYSDAKRASPPPPGNHVAIK
jgi:hypothetical protein